MQSVVVSRNTGRSVPKKNRIRLENGLLPGDIILLWRIQFGTFTTETWHPKYFETTYGIDSHRHLQQLIAKGYVLVETAFDSLDHLSSQQKKAILKEQGVTGLSKMKAMELTEALYKQLSEEELGQCFSIRGLALTTKGQEALQQGQFVVDAHPKKN